MFLNFFHNFSLLEQRNFLNYAIKKFSENKVKVYFGSSLGDKALRVKIWDFFPNRLES
ncbi:conserved domain protein [Parasutterella excrementihominis YIT 11859]|uniref:Conserved domain protein n=1 Tax=Parasutterella excrementihominis YIT 11859 TaxID=762966 RepID=F3QNH2_9BURK|nr:conserved domain protein [Parasutterella excrementihominis YIT 11859]